MASNASSPISIDSLQAKIDALRIANGMAPVPPVVEEDAKPLPSVTEEPEELDDVKAMLEEHEQLTADLRTLRRAGSYLDEMRAVMRQSSISAADKRYYYDRLDAIIPAYYDVVEGVVDAIKSLESALAEHA